MAVVEKVREFSKVSDATFLPDDSIPEIWDWRNIGGYDFTDELRDQGHCGSCYTQSFIQSVNSRLKIKYAEEAMKK